MKKRKKRELKKLASSFFSPFYTNNAIIPFIYLVFIKTCLKFFLIIGVTCHIIMGTIWENNQENLTQDFYITCCQNLTSYNLYHLLMLLFRLQQTQTIHFPYCKKYCDQSNNYCY